MLTGINKSARPWISIRGMIANAKKRSRLLPEARFWSLSTRKKLDYLKALLEQSRRIKVRPRRPNAAAS